MNRTRAFTLVELLVVIGIIALLMGMLLPALNKARKAANTAACLSNIRNMQVAHWLYITDNKGWIIQAGLGHGGADANEGAAWINTLQPYYKNRLLHRCPSDDSPHWPGGEPVPGSTDQFRRTSYGINNFLDWELCPWGGPYKKINQVRKASSVIQFLEMAETGDFAGADHPHIENWQPALMPKRAADQLAVGRHGGSRAGWNSVANYGFLDGHAETLTLSEVFTNFNRNRFDPLVAQ